MKTCGKCKTSKPLEQFSRRGSGRQAWCKACVSAHKLEWIAANREKVRWNALWHKYRLRPEDWDRLWRLQDGRCAVCRNAEPTHVDHDHACCPERRSCGKCVRGLLCGRCNVIVGFAEMDADLLRQAHDYLALSSIG